MGFDLRLLPQSSKNADFSHDVLSCHRDSDMFDIISELENSNGRPISKNGIQTFVAEDNEGRYHYGLTTGDRYGQIIKGVQAGELKKTLLLYKTGSYKNKAIIAFINELPDDLEIYLFWH